MGIIQTGPGSPLAFSSASGGKVRGFNTLDNTSAVEVAPANPSRQKIIFHNPGTVDVLVYPKYFINTGSDVVAAPTVAARGGCFLIFANGGALEITGECSQAWYALSASGAGNPLTVMDSNT